MNKDQIVKIAAMIVGVGVVGIVTIPLLSGWAQKMIYPVPGYPVAAPAEIEVHTIESPSGPLSAWLHRAKPIGSSDAQASDKRTPVIIYFHGNGENLGTLWDYGLFAQIAELECHILALDYPGYGASAGAPSEASLIESGRLALVRAKDLFPDSPVVLMGWSLGAAVAIQTAAADVSQLDGLIVMSPWSSLMDVASAHFPRFLVKTLIDERYDSEAAAKSVALPVLVMHGDRDAVIPVSQGARVAKAFPRATWVSVPGYGHADLFGSETVIDHWRQFMSRIKRE